MTQKRERDEEEVGKAIGVKTSTKNFGSSFQKRKKKGKKNWFSIKKREKKFFYANSFSIKFYATRKKVLFFPLTLA